jgi:hypothetical protein
MTDTEVVYDPDTYVDGVPFGALARLRHGSPVVWVEETPGPGFWLVLRHADVEEVLTRPHLFSSWLGATQIRDPATPEALAYVRRMMLNMDPPEHARLRKLLSRSFTPRSRNVSKATPAPSVSAPFPPRQQEASATSRRMQPPTCPCSPSRTCSACPSRIADCCSTGRTGSSDTRIRITHPRPSSTRQRGRRSREKP